MSKEFTIEILLKNVATEEMEKKKKTYDMTTPIGYPLRADLWKGSWKHPKPPQTCHTLSPVCGKWGYTAIAGIRLVRGNSADRDNSLGAT